MNDEDKIKRQKIIGQIRDLVFTLDREVNPFLFYLPDILNRQKFNGINAEKTLEFARQATRFDCPEMIKDALKVLNNTVEPLDGKLKKPARDIFYGNNHFVWSELGGYTDAEDIIMHILNKALFVISVGH